ncbi:uncharacterized protein [Neodiprion pinetum]|uniref:uncharacterized protein n=1 Tax=Neodiprion pinetum TaxID=441929 RepID=UPI001EDCEDA3|nr:uncharacterized protein LOC124222889 [Neodiprion pinetum]
MDVGGSRVTNIFDLPREMIVRIFLYFNPKERLRLARTCRTFEELVFGDMELLRNLDFSRIGLITTVADVWEYFESETVNQYIRKVNVSNVSWMRPGQILNNTIGRAVNLVDVNIFGRRFRDLQQLVSLLELLINLKRLSFDWPDGIEDVSHSIDILRTPFGRLKYLAVKVSAYSINFFPTLQWNCNELVELRIIALPPRDGKLKLISWPLYGHDKLKKLKIVQAHGWNVHRTIYRHIVNMVPDLNQWTDFQTIGSDLGLKGFYLEKNIEICHQLRKTRVANNVPHRRPPDNFPHTWSVLSECLVREAIRLTHERVPKDFCCLRRTAVDSSATPSSWPLALRIDEAKRLLKDPEYQISLLYLEHDIDTHCDVHLVASAFPNLRNLFLCRVLRSRDRTQGAQYLPRRLTKEGSGTPAALQDVAAGGPHDSSFKILVENTPLLRDLTICYWGHADPQLETWDFDALLHISQWRNLTALRLAFVPVHDGQFLIDVGKHCVNLETLVLVHLGTTGHSRTYMSDLAEMLRHCRNMREFFFEDDQVFGAHEVLMALTNNLKLERIEMEFYERGEDYARMMASMYHLLRTCTLLNKFKYTNIWTTTRNLYLCYLVTRLRRIRGELNRPDFQFEVLLPNYGIQQDSPNVDIILHEYPPWYDFNCRLIYPLFSFENHFWANI